MSPQGLWWHWLNPLPLFGGKRFIHHTTPLHDRVLESFWNILDDVFKNWKCGCKEEYNKYPMNRLVQRRKSAPIESSPTPHVVQAWGSPMKRSRGGKLTTRFSRKSNSFSAENCCHSPRRHSFGAAASVVKDIEAVDNSCCEDKLKPTSDQIKRLQSIASVYLWSPRGKRYVAFMQISAVVVLNLPLHDKYFEHVWNARWLSVTVN